jgi:formylglycine-generating enzyme required for sulfatase activity
MKTNILRFLPVGLVGIALLIFSFSEQKINAIPTPKGFVFVPMSTYSFVPDTGKGKTISIQAFFISETEVTNAQYNEFLKDLKAQGKTNEYHIAFPDTNNWNSSDFNISILKSFYHSGKSFENCPVVNISYEAAMMYCKWLTEKYEKETGIKLQADFRLPCKEEWDFVSKFDAKTSFGPYLFFLENKENKPTCNYNKVDQESIFFNDSTKKVESRINKENMNLRGEISTPIAVKQFEPNSFGIYDIYGNVAEMTNVKGIALGGSFNSYGGDIISEKPTIYKPSSCEVGFRVVMTVLNTK